MAVSQAAEGLNWSKLRWKRDFALCWSIFSCPWTSGPLYPRTPDLAWITPQPSQSSSLQTADGGTSGPPQPHEPIPHKPLSVPLCRSFMVSLETWTNMPGGSMQPIMLPLGSWEFRVVSTEESLQKKNQIPFVWGPGVLPHLTRPGAASHCDSLAFVSLSSCTLLWWQHLSWALSHVGHTSWISLESHLPVVQAV